VGILSPNHALRPPALAAVLPYACLAIMCLTIKGLPLQPDEAESYEEVSFGRRQPDSVVVDGTQTKFIFFYFLFLQEQIKDIIIIEFKHTSDQRRDFRERGASRAKHNTTSL